MALEILEQGFEAVRPFLEQVYPALSSRLPELGVLTLSIVVYSILIYKFYHFIAKRDVFGFDEKEFELERFDSFRKLSGTLAGFVKYGLFFPIIVFLWFAGFSILFFFMAKGLQTPQLLLVSITFVTAIRIASYYTEDLSKDMAKLIPFALLGTAILEPGFFSLDLVSQRIQTLPEFLIDLLAYFAFVVSIEWGLRILLAVKHGLFGVSHTKEEKTS